MRLGGEGGEGGEEWGKGGEGGRGDLSGQRKRLPEGTELQWFMRALHTRV